MTDKHGNLSINSENIFPIIKKWMYSDHDIFLREMVSNASDAITKLKKLDVMGEYDLPDDYEPNVRVLVNDKDKTLKIIDNGLGMTADEVEEYINQIAFSGATDFLEKHKGKADEDQIIGHFGLGFYSAFMVSDEVEIDTLSYKDGSTAVHWICDGGTEFAMSDGTRDSIGTTITLHINEDCLEFANEYRIREVLEKYCSFMPYPIFLKNENAEVAYETINADEVTEKDTVIEEFTEPAKTHEEEKEDGTKETIEDTPETKKAKIVKREVSVNDTTPLWTKNPSECTEDEYKEFYRKVFRDYKEPLFWIHLNMDYPFNLKGILYFPKINLEYESAEGVIKLYNNQVFIADNIKEVIPEFLMLLKGVIDCPDLPLNVSRSALQNDGFVTKISDYITKKVADKLTGMCKTEKEDYEKYWDDISPFIKYGCLKDTKFCDKMNDYILFKDLDDKYQTLPELLKPVEEDKDDSGNADADKTTDEAGANDTAQTVENADGTDATSDPADTTDTTADEAPKDERNIVYYVTDVTAQGQYIKMFKEQGLNAVLLTHPIDTSFITQLESRNEHYKFCRIDADVTESLKEDVAEEDLKDDTEALTKAFHDALGNDNLTVKAEKLKDESIASVLTLSEESRRMGDMMKMYSMYGAPDDSNMFMGDETLTLNLNHPLVQFLLEHKKSKNVPTFCKQLYDLAKVANHPLSASEMTEFVKRSNEIMLLLAK